MAKQLVYTSVPRGLLPGTSGYCTVAMTEGFPRAQADYVEKLSAYRINDRDGSKTLTMNAENYDRLLRLNPPNIAHIKYQFRGKATSVLLKTSLAGFDYSNRLRKLTHYLLLDEDNKATCDLGGLVSNGNLFLNSWDRDPEMLPPLVLDCEPVEPKECRAWQRLAGDAGWAGELVRAVCSQAKSPVHIIYDPKVSAIPLLIEALAILPRQRRWEATFSTNYVALQQSNVQCQWRFIPVASPEAGNVAHLNDGMLIDLTTNLGSPTDCAEAASARLGKTAEVDAVADPGGDNAWSKQESAAELSTRIGIAVPENEPGVSETRIGLAESLMRLAQRQSGKIGIAIVLAVILLALFFAIRSNGIIGAGSFLGAQYRQQIVFTSASDAPLCWIEQNDKFVPSNETAGKLTSQFLAGAVRSAIDGPAIHSFRHPPFPPSERRGQGDLSSSRTGVLN